MTDRLRAWLGQAWTTLRALARAVAESGLIRDAHVYGGTVLLSVGAEHLVDGLGFLTGGAVLVGIGVFGLPSFDAPTGEPA